MSHPKPMRAKLTLQTITRSEYGDELSFHALYSSSPEDNTYAAATPFAELKMQVNNPDLMGSFEPGSVYYVDFTPVPDVDMAAS